MVFYTGKMENEMNGGKVRALLWVMGILISPPLCSMETDPVKTLLAARISGDSAQAQILVTSMKESEDPRVRSHLARHFLDQVLKDPDQSGALRESIIGHMAYAEEFIRTQTLEPRDSIYLKGKMIHLKKDYETVFHQEFDPDQLDPRTRFERLLEKARTAQKNWYRIQGACYKVSVKTANLNEAPGRDWNWQKFYSQRGRPLEALNQALDLGWLLPGMVIYVNTQPGKDPSSTKMEYKPHWFTYLGKDQNNVPRFADQYFLQASLSRMMQVLPGRKIDTVYDPYKRSH